MAHFSSNVFGNYFADEFVKIVSVQNAKKVVSDSPGLVDFAIGLVNSVLNLPDGQVNYFEEINSQKNSVTSILVIKKFCGLVEMMFVLVNASFSMPERQAVKMTFFAPCSGYDQDTETWISPSQDGIINIINT